MKKYTAFIYFLSALFCMVPYTGYAQEQTNTLKMEELAIQVMPEFAFHPKDKKKDHPPLLIGYQGTLMNGSAQPQKGKIEIPLPMKDENFRIGFVADYSSDLSEMHEIQYEINQEKGTIAWETTNEIKPNDLYKFVIEFYTDRIKANKESKKLTYSFKSFADIGLVSVTFLEPIKAKNVKLSPKPDNQQGNTYGMKLHSYQMQGLKTGDEKRYEFSYERSETKTVSEIMNEVDGHNSEKQTAKPSKKTDQPSMAVIISIVALSILAVGAMILLLLKKRNGSNPVSAGIQPEERAAKKAHLRKMLVEGTISEQEYNELLKKMGS